ADSELPRKAQWTATIADARKLPDAGSIYSAVITSPPYPNRHDYTRVFGVELMFGFLDWAGTRKLRYQSFCSNPESKPTRPDSRSYVEPKKLENVLEEMKGEEREERIVNMLRGYFVDMFLCLREAARVCRPGGYVAFIVGNAQYYGQPILVDELTAEIGVQVG